MDELTKVFDEKTYFLKNRILIKLTKKEIKDTINKPKKNEENLEYLSEVFLYYKEDLVSIFDDLEKKILDFSYFKFIFERYNTKETFISCLKNTKKDSLFKFFEECFIPFDDFSELVVSLGNELKEESKFLTEEEFNVVYINEVLNSLEGYSYFL